MSVAVSPELNVLSIDMKKQIVIIHGGNAFFPECDYINDYLKKKKVDIETFKSKISNSWKENLELELGPDFEVFCPQMPNKENARYEEWRIWFERLIPFLEDNIILIGHSLGGTFLVKYLSENKFSKSIQAVFLVAPAYDKDMKGDPLGTFALPKKLNLQTEHVYIYQSKDDPAVPSSAISQFKKALPIAIDKTFIDRGHFRDEKFPEIVDDIVNLWS